MIEQDSGLRVFLHLLGSSSCYCPLSPQNQKSIWQSERNQSCFCPSQRCEGCNYSQSDQSLPMSWSLPGTLKQGPLGIDLVGPCLPGVYHHRVDEVNVYTSSRMGNRGSSKSLLKGRLEIHKVIPRASWNWYFKCLISA